MLSLSRRWRIGEKSSSSPSFPTRHWKRWKDLWLERFCFLDNYDMFITLVERFRKETRNGTAKDAATPSIEWLFPLKNNSGDEELGDVSRIGKKRANTFDDGGLFKGGFASDDDRGKPVHLDRAEDYAEFLQSQKKSGSAQKFSLKTDNGNSPSLISPTSLLAN